VKSLVLADVHADADALERVLEDAAGGWDRLLLLGDLIGYGREPVQVVARLRGLGPAAAVLGNHEAMLAELLAGRRPHASRAVVEALEAHAEALDEEQLRWLVSLPLRAVAPGEAGAVGLVHANPDPDRPFDYLLGVPSARRAARYADRPVTLFGHTHVPGGFVEQDGRWRPLAARGAEALARLPAGARAFLNPGSVAAARDGGPGACYLVLDHATGEARFRRLGAR
jgi:diadenosine tetraphosphatase ApaH/serine/threonine PP2A family protein phosphatase